MAVSIEDIKKLRHMTGAGMMDCKNALAETGGDIQGAIEIIRKKGQAVAAKREDRQASEGCVLAAADADFACIVALKCETDFVAKNEGFIAFTTKILDAALANMPATTEDLLAIQLDGRSIADQIAEQTGVIGEKLELSYYGSVKAEDCVIYIHPGNMLATVVGFNKTADAQVKKNIAMQVAAMAPVAVDKDGIPQNVIDHEFEIGREKAREEGKPENMLDKIAQGRLNKFFQESTLLNQVFEQDGKMSVKEYLKSVDKDLTVTAFLRFTLNA